MERLKLTGRMVEVPLTTFADRCLRCGHALGHHDEKECRGGEDLPCACDSFEEEEKVVAKNEDLHEALVELKQQVTWVLTHSRDDDAIIHEALDGELALKMKAVRDIALEIRTPPVRPRSLGVNEKAKDLPLCPNCGQWQHAENGGDCLHECRTRGFA